MSPSMRLFLLAIALLGVGLTEKALAENPTPNYALTDTLPLPGSTRWDYLTFDASAHRLFITRGDSVDVMDTNSKKIIGTISSLDGVHGVALAPDLKKGFITEGKVNKVDIFDLGTLNLLAKVSTGKKPDAVVYDPLTHRVFAADGDSGDLTVIDAAKGAVIATVKLDGKPEFAVVDGKGKLYVNLEDKAQIAVVDTKTLKGNARYDLAPACDSPTGLAIDKTKHRLFAACSNKVMPIVNTKTGKIVDTIAIGDHSDAVAFDDKTGLAFSSNGEGSLTVIGLNDTGHYDVVQTVETKPTARTMALDPKTHTIYLAAAETESVDPPDEKHSEPRAHIKPDTFMILTVIAGP